MAMPSLPAPAAIRAATLRETKWEGDNDEAVKGQMNIVSEMYFQNTTTEESEACKRIFRTKEGENNNILFTIGLRFDELGWSLPSTVSIARERCDERVL